MVRFVWLYALSALFFISGCDDGEEAESPPAQDAAASAGSGGSSVDAEVTEPDSAAAGDAAIEVDAALPVVIDYRVPGLSGPVTVNLDAQGVLHIACQANDDCFAVQGYLQAAQRFGQMDIRRRLTRGRLSALIGDVTLDTDRHFRHFIAARDGARLDEIMWEGTRPQMKVTVEAYARGVNAWLEDLKANENGAKLPEEYTFPLVDSTALDAWDVLDSTACILALINDLTNDSSKELLRGEVFSQMAPAQAFDLFAPVSGSPSTIIPQGAAEKHALSPVELNRHHARLAPYASLLSEARGALEGMGAMRGDEGGSNNWVIGPSMTASGESYMSNDPHLKLSNPSIWHMIEMRSEEGLHIAGASFAGLPGIVLGQNEQIAWGGTVAFFDMADVYLETLSPDGSGVMFNGEVVPFVERAETFIVKDAEDVVETLHYVPHHGPVMAMDVEAGTAVTIRWTGHDNVGELNFLYDLWFAQSAAEAKAALSQVNSAGQNFVVADREGHISWMPYNRVPHRPWASAELMPWLPLPGDGSAEWEGTVPIEDLPQLHDPAEGYIVTANNDMTGALADGDPTNDEQPAMQNFPAAGWRHERVIERIEELGGGLTTEDMQSIQSDTKILMAERVIPGLLEVGVAQRGALSQPAQHLVDALSAWDLFCPTGLEAGSLDSARVAGPEAASSIGCAAFHVSWSRLKSGLFLDELEASEISYMPMDAAVTRVMSAPERLLAGDVYWDDVSTDGLEPREAIITSALEAAAAHLTDKLGADPDGWRWGYLHTLTLRADLFDDAGVPIYNNGPNANDGGLHSVDVAKPRNVWADDYSHTNGASMRFVCRLNSEGVRCNTQLPGGQVHHPGDPHYDDLLAGYLANQPFDLPFSPEEVAAATVEILDFQPE